MKLDAFNPAQALDFFKGFVYGSQNSYCSTFSCANNVTYFVTNVQSAITALEGIINGNFNPEMILPLVCNFNTVFQSYELLYTECGIAGFLNSFDLWTSVAGLEMIAKNSVMHLGYFLEAYDALKVCDTNYNACGAAVGKVYSQMTGWYVTDTNSLSASFEADDIPIFMSGLLEGIASSELHAANAWVRQVISDVARLSQGDLDIF